MHIGPSAQEEPCETVAALHTLAGDVDFFGLASEAYWPEVTSLASSSSTRGGGKSPETFDP